LRRYELMNSLVKPETPQPFERAPALSRRQLLAGALSVGALATLPAASAAEAAPPNVPADPTKIPGPGPSEFGARSALESSRRVVGGTTSSRTPLQDLHGIITPSDLHFERHHAGVPAIDPKNYTLLVHGLVDRPMVFTLDDLKRFPSVSRICFLECSGNQANNSPERTRPQQLAGLTSTSEWTGVPLSAILREVGVQREAAWFLAEGQDAAVLTRSIPVEKAWDDGMLAYAQNGEAIRPSNGYPVRLLLPGWEGNANVKWLRRLEFADQPFMTREETSHYTEAIGGGKIRQFSFMMDAKSIITSPSYPAKVQPGWIEWRGLAWSGRGRIERVEMSFDEGKTWRAAELQEPVLSKAHTRFRHLWEWDGRETTVLSRATDETGYMQPSLRELAAARGVGTNYHFNQIMGWRLQPDGQVVYRTEAWQ
jgi:sulfane dehydrogenase subunit SoxC